MPSRRVGIVQTPAVALRSFPYGETSLVLRFYTEVRGVLGVLAKGARRRGSKGRGVPETFSGGVLTVYVKESRGLQTMKDFAVQKPRRGIGRDVVRLAGASVVGEILLRHAGEEGHPPLYRQLDGALDRVESVPSERLVPEILARGWSLVAALGYAPALTRCASCGDPLGEDEMGRFDFAAGGVRCRACAVDESGPRIGPGARAQLADLLRGREVDDLRRPRAHVHLLDDFVTYHLSEGRRLRSFRVLRDVLPAPSATVSRRSHETPDAESRPS